MVRERSEAVIIGRLLGAASFGVFAVGSEIGALATTEFVSPLYRALFSGFAAAHRAGLGVAQVCVRVIAAALLVTAPAAIGISLVADPLVRLALGERWLAAVPLVWVLAVPGAVTVLSHVGAAALNAEGLPRLNCQLATIATVFKLPLMAVLVWAFGLTGGAVALALALSFEQLLFLEVMRRRLTLALSELARQTWRPLLATAVMAATLAGLGLGWTGSPADNVGAARQLVVAMAAGAAVYFATLTVAWIAAGRPAGAETDLLHLAQSSLSRFRLPRLFGLPLGSR